MKGKSKKTNTKTNVNASVFDQKPKTKIYLSYWFRLIFNVALFVCFITLSFITASKTVEREKTKPINYIDDNQIDYKVFLKENDIYKEDYLGMNRAYVANLVDRIDINYYYLFEIDKITNMNFDYKIMAELVIENSNGTKFVDEEYVLKAVETKKLQDAGNMIIKDTAVIDYDYYNSLANKFKNQTGVDITSYLNVYLQVDKKTDEKLNYNIKETSKSNIKIPLSERAIEINLTTDQKTVKKQVYPKGKVIFNPLYLCLEIVFFVLSCIFLVKIIKYVFSVIKDKTKYDKYINKILKNYDRLIVETNSVMDFTDCKIIDVINFNELLDVRDNLKQPIIYNNIVKHQKGMFYIRQKDDVYRYIVKEVDLK